MGTLKITKDLDPNTFRNTYYLKEELVSFARENNIPTSLSKIELTNAIAYFLETGKILLIKKENKAKNIIDNITLDSIIEENITCSEIHRAFFKNQIGKTFSFNVLFQNWLKENSGKTYKDAIDAYYMILEDKKKNKTTIDKQFEYNTYIRAFFDDNRDKTLEEAIICWKYKKSLCGSHAYEADDLKALIKE